MTNQIYPCLWFDGKAREAAEFYCSVFKNSKITSDTPLVVMFELNGKKMMGLNGKKMMGLNGGPRFKFNPSISLFVTAETINETNEIWNKLIVGGKALMDIGKYPWSERYGWLEDKFGFTWQVSLNFTDSSKLNITPSMLFTDKQFGKAEEAIKFYTSIFENSSIETLLHYPKEDPNAGKTLFSEFLLNNYLVIGMDGPGEHNYSFNEAVSFVVSCKTQKEIDHYWSGLTKGGNEVECGWLKDKFGVSWQIVPEILGKLMEDPKKAPAVMKEVMKMKKLDIEKLQEAAK